LKIFVYLDESGSIHKNSKTRYFAVGGYFTFQEDKNKILALYKKINKEIKDTRKIDVNKEIKSYNMTDDNKKNFFGSIQDINTFYGCAKVFDKSRMTKEIVESNIFFNYATRILFKDCIVPILNIKRISETIEFVVSVDNRNIRVGELNNLETYLNTEFCLEKLDFKIKYYDSSTNYGIQLADLIVNTFYNSYKNINIVKNVMPILNKKKYKVSLFPCYKIMDRIKKKAYNKNENN